MSLSKAAISAINRALEPAIRLIGERSADMAALTLISYGITTQDMSFDDVMAVGAETRIGSLAATGFFNYVPLEDGLSLAADHFAETCRDPLAMARVKKAGLIYNAVLIDLHHFTPLYQMIDSALTANNEDMVFPPVLELKPCSEGATRWARELGSPLHYTSPVLSVPPEELKTLADKVALEAIKEKELITEAEAAELLSCSPKSLGNQRRAGEVNRSVFTQMKANGKVLYCKAGLLAAVGNKTLFVPPKHGKKR